MRFYCRNGIFPLRKSISKAGTGTGNEDEGYYGNGQFVGPDPVPKLISGKRVIVVYLMENCKRIVGRVFPLKEIQQL